MPFLSQMLLFCDTFLRSFYHSVEIPYLPIIPCQKAERVWIQYTKLYGFNVVGRPDRRTIRRIERYEHKNEADLEVKREKLVQELELVARNVTIVSNLSRSTLGTRSRLTECY